MSWHTTREGLMRPVMRAEAPPAEGGRIRDEQEGARRFVDRHFPVVAEFLATGAAPDVDLMRAEAPQVTSLPGRAPTAAGADVMRGHDDPMRPVARQAATPRTVAVRLLDTHGATLTVACPQWCVTDHFTDVQRGVLAADFTHCGAWQDLTPGEDDEPVLSVRIEQRPFSAVCSEPVAGLSAAAGQTEEDLTPDGVYALADRLRAFADRLDDLGVDLDDARRTARMERGGAL